MKVDLLDTKFRQTFCPDCCGLKRLVVNGMVIPPSKWGKYNLANDIGCICKNPNLKK